MIHLVPTDAPEARPQPYAEAVSRLASIRHALRLVDAFGAGPASDPASDERLAAAWNDADEATQRCFDRRSERLVGATAAGVEALLIERENGHEPNAEASRALVEQIHRELAQVSRLVLA